MRVFENKTRVLILNPEFYEKEYEGLIEKWENEIKEELIND
jgi:hypothetical protein